MPVVFGVDGDGAEFAEFDVDTAVYSRESTFRACYVFTDRCYLFLEREADGHLVVHLRAQGADVDLKDVAGKFANELVNQRVRADIARETHAIREMIVSQAFAEAEFNEHTEQNG